MLKQACSKSQKRKNPNRKSDQNTLENSISSHDVMSYCWKMPNKWFLSNFLSSTVFFWTKVQHHFRVRRPKDQQPDQICIDSLWVWIKNIWDIHTSNSWCDRATGKHIEFSVHPLDAEFSKLLGPKNPARFPTKIDQNWPIPAILRTAKIENPCTGI